MRKTVTLVWLRKMNACSAGIVWFKSTFGKSASVRVTIKALVNRDEKEKSTGAAWLCWLCDTLLNTDSCGDDDCGDCEKKIIAKVYRELRKG